jgi:ribosome-binding ATPase YchF (GTP1/OBG family)
MLSAGIVGLPNVGKSTLFNAVTRTQKAQAANYPFCTIDPNVGVVTVPDPRLAALTKLSNSKKTVPAAIEFVDIAWAGERRERRRRTGQSVPQSHPRGACHRAGRALFRERRHSSRLRHGSIPVRDIEVINTELILADLASVQKARRSPDARPAR